MKTMSKEFDGICGSYLNRSEFFLPEQFCADYHSSWMATRKLDLLMHDADVSE
jgi:hypothetical protein